MNENKAISNFYMERKLYSGKKNTIKQSESKWKKYIYGEWLMLIIWQLKIPKWIIYIGQQFLIRPVGFKTNSFTDFN